MTKVQFAHLSNEQLIEALTSRIERDADFVMILRAQKDADQKFIEAIEAGIAAMRAKLAELQNS